MVAQQFTRVLRISLALGRHAHRKENTESLKHLNKHMAV